jgi:uncharacterized protein YraI
MVLAAVLGPLGGTALAGSHVVTEADGVPGKVERPPTYTTRETLASPTAAAAPVVGSYSRVTYSALNMRTGAGTGYSIIRTMRKGEIVAVLGGPYNSSWYKVRYRGSIGYSYSPGLAHTGLAGTSIAPYYSKVVVVSLARQQLEMYQNGRLYMVAAVTTGRPDLATPTGTFRVFAKYSPYTFHSPWPKGSPYWYPDSTAQYAAKFTSGGHYLHDAPWRPYYGYGTNYNHQDPDGAWRTGSHGCVNVTGWAMPTLYSWATLGTYVRIVSY